METKTVIIFAYLASIFLVHGQDIDPVEGYKGKETVASEHGLAVGNLKLSLSMYSLQHDGKIPQKWADITHGLEHVNEFLGYDVSKEFVFVESHKPIPDIDGPVVLVSRKPLAKGPSGSLVRYVVWKQKDSIYAVTPVDEDDFEPLLEEYQIQLSTNTEPALKQTITSKAPVGFEVPEIIQSVEEITPPEPTNDRPVEVSTSKPAEHPEEKSSNWWLWLIGLLVVIGGLAVVVRRKS